MGRLYAEFDQQLATWRARYRHRPRDEVNRLLLLALEREQLVSVAYREQLLSTRIDALPVSDDLRALLSQSLAWTWKDEEMHAVFTRGLLRKVGTLGLRARALLQESEGSVAGWASSVQQHVRWSEAPLARSAAWLLTRVGKLMGKVPRALRRELGYLSFPAFCRLQVDAERTAAACWQRLAELAESYPGIDERTRLEFISMGQDEVRHGRVFEIIADSLEDDGTLKSEASESGVTQRIREVGEFFLPRALRAGALAENPLGGGGRVCVLRGGPELDQASALRRVLDDAGLPEVLRQRATALGKPVADLVVAVKANFMLGYDRRDRAILTDRPLLEQLARYLGQHGAGEIVVCEGRNIYDQFHAGRSVAEVARFFGLESDLYRICDLTADQVTHEYPRGMAQDTLSRTWRDADLRIVCAKLRSHPVDFTHLAIGGLQGVGRRLEDFLFAERQAHRATALLMPLTEFPPHFALLDGYESAADGLCGIIACARPARPRRFYAGRDALAVDMVASRHMGLSDPRSSEILDAACHWFGDPTSSTRILGPDEPIPGWRHPYHNGFSRLLSLLADPVYEFASARGASFLPPLDPEAFPALEREGRLFRARRWFVRKLLGLRPPPAEWSPS